MARVPLDFHHVGIACNSIEKDLSAWLKIGYTVETEIFVEIDQGVRGLFLTGGGPRIELLEALPGSDTLKPWLKRGATYYHFGYFVPDLGTALSELRRDGAVVAREPIASTFFGGRSIAFLVLENMSMIELIAAAP